MLCRSAERLLRLFQKNKGIYVKAGQRLSSLDYLVPFEFVFAMTPLHDKVFSTTIPSIHPP